VLSVALIAIGDISFKSEVVAAERLFFEGDMVRGRPKSGPTGPVCVLTSQFKRLEKVVWRIRVFDPANSKQLGKEGLKSMFVELPDGKRFKMRYGGHPPKKSTDNFWTTSWDIPANYPTGSFAYKVIATDSDGKVHNWQPFNVRGSQFTVIAGKIK
jgi:hypothetical protein